jgi:ribosomal protein S1
MKTLKHYFKRLNEAKGALVLLRREFKIQESNMQMDLLIAQIAKLEYEAGIAKKLTDIKATFDA